jgi:hypothetical protein
MSVTSDPEYSNDAELVNRFLVTNPEFEELTARLTRFNVFSIVKAEFTEIRHSNVLAWLFNPQESHGLGDTILRRFLSTILLEKGSLESALTPAHCELSNLGDAEVFREWKNIDILVSSKSAKLVIVIENKIRAGVGNAQLEKYKVIVEREFPEYRKIYILLSRFDGEWDNVAEDCGYLSWGHDKMIQLVKPIVDQSKSRIPENIGYFINDYIEMVRRITMQENELGPLCKEIYRKHGHAIETIMKYGRATMFQSAAEAFLSDHAEWKQLLSEPTKIWFIPMDWLDKHPQDGQAWQNLDVPYPVVLRFFGTQSRVGLIMEIGPWDNSQRRQDLIREFEKSGFKMRKKAFRENARYTKLISEYYEIDDPDNPEEIRDALQRLFDDVKPSLMKADSVIKEFRWQ